MGDIFISYSSKDSARATALRDWLKANGYSVWSDQEIKGGEPFRAAIVEALAKARCAIVIWTPDSVRSHYVLDEAETARAAGRLIPVTVSGFNIQEIPVGFRSLRVLQLDDLAALPGALKRLEIEPCPAAAATDAGRAKPISRAALTIGEITERAKRTWKIRVAVGAVTVPLAVVLLIAFPSAMFGILLAAAVIFILMLFLS